MNKSDINLKKITQMSLTRAYANSIKYLITLEGNQKERDQLFELVATTNPVLGVEIEESVFYNSEFKTNFLDILLLHKDEIDNQKIILLYIALLAKNKISDAKQLYHYMDINKRFYQLKSLKSYFSEASFGRHLLLLCECHYPWKVILGAMDYYDGSFSLVPSLVNEVFSYYVKSKAYLDLNTVIRFLHLKEKYNWDYYSNDEIILLLIRKYIDEKIPYDSFGFLVTKYFGFDPVRKKYGTVEELQKRKEALLELYTPQLKWLIAYLVEQIDERCRLVYVSETMQPLKIGRQVLRQLYRDLLVSQYGEEKVQQSDDYLSMPILLNEEIIPVKDLRDIRKHVIENYELEDFILHVEQNSKLMEYKYSIYITRLYQLFDYVENNHFIFCTVKNHRQFVRDRLIYEIKLLLCALKEKRGDFPKTVNPGKLNSTAIKTIYSVYQRQHDSLAASIQEAFSEMDLLLFCPEKIFRVRSYTSLTDTQEKKLEAMYQDKIMMLREIVEQLK